MFSTALTKKTIATVAAVATAFTTATATAADPHAHGERSSFKTRDAIGAETNHPTSVYKTFGTGVVSPLKKRGEFGTLVEYASSFIEQELHLRSSGYRVRSSATTEIGSHLWIQRVVNGIPVANAVGNIALNKEENIVAFGANFHGENGARGNVRIASATPAITAEQAIHYAEETLQATHNDREPHLAYYVEPSGDLALTYVVQVITPDEDHFYEAFVNVESGEVIAFNDFVSHAAYKAVSPTAQAVDEDYRVFYDPADTFSSPNGWHNLTANDTSGNNAIAFYSVAWNTTKASAPDLVFNYTYDLSLNTTGGPNIDAGRTNAFYLSNLVHDIHYHYGFTEATFNFQKDNFGKGGLDNDPILISVHDGGDSNNAQFNAPPDGQSGAMKLYVWLRTNPRRASALQNDASFSLIIAHEQTHGTTNRMTGGGTGGCLQTLEARGMGEGWSDAFAEWLEHTDATVPDFTMARWVFNSPNGYRTHPYSTDPAVNPLKYGDVANMTQPHDIGEVWANMLHNVYAGLVAQSGWASDSFTNPDSSSGNVVFLRNFMDGLLLQPCNPTFVQARDAWIQADINRYGGAHQCTIWNAFASRGLGVAAANFVNDFNLPEVCGGTPPSQPAAEEPTGSIPDPTELPTSTLAEIPTIAPGL